MHFLKKFKRNENMFSKCNDFYLSSNSAIFNPGIKNGGYNIMIKVDVHTKALYQFKLLRIIYERNRREIKDVSKDVFFIFPSGSIIFLHNNQFK